MARSKGQIVSSCLQGHTQSAVCTALSIKTSLGGAFSIERGTPPALSRRTCSPRYGVQPGEGNRRASRNNTRELILIHTRPIRNFHIDVWRASANPFNSALVSQFAAFFWIYGVEGTAHVVALRMTGLPLRYALDVFILLSGTRFWALLFGTRSRRCYFEKIRVFKAGNRSEYISME